MPLGKLHSLIVSLAVKVCTVKVFSLIDIILLVAPASPEGPVMIGFVSSTSVTVTVTVCSEERSALSVALTVTT